MPKLFHLRCSPRAASESSAGAEAFVTRFLQARPDWDIDVMDIWRETLPEFEGATLEAKYTRLSGREFSGAERDAFQPFGSHRARILDAIERRVELQVLARGQVGIDEALMAQQADASARRGPKRSCRLAEEQRGAERRRRETGEQPDER